MLWLKERNKMSLDPKILDDIKKILLNAITKLHDDEFFVKTAAELLKKLDQESDQNDQED